METTLQQVFVIEPVVALPLVVRHPELLSNLRQRYSLHRAAIFWARKHNLITCQNTVGPQYPTVFSGIPQMCGIHSMTSADTKFHI